MIDKVPDNPNEEIDIPDGLMLPSLPKSQRNARAWAMYEMLGKGASYKEIADHFATTIGKVAKACNEIDQFLSKFYVSKVIEMRVRHTQQLQDIRRKAMEGWERSLEDSVTKEDEDGMGAKGFISKTKTTIKGQAGDPRFLSIAKDCIESVGKIWGINESEPENKVPINVNVGVSVIAREAMQNAPEFLEYLEQRKLDEYRDSVVVGGDDERGEVQVSAASGDAQSCGAEDADGGGWHSPIDGHDAPEAWKI